MNNNKQNIDQLFKQKLEHFELSTEGASWKMLQLVKVKNSNLKRIFFSKMFTEMILLSSVIIIMVTSTPTHTTSSLIKPLYTQEKTDEINNLNVKTSSEMRVKNLHPTTNLYKDSERNIHSHKNENKMVLFPNVNDSDLEAEINFQSKDIKRLIISESITTYKEWTKNKKINILKANNEEVNSSFDEYAPVINKDGSFMFFTSRRPVTNKEVRVGKGKERIYYTETTETGWTKAQLLESPLNSEKSYNSAVALSKDGKSLFIYRDDRFGNGDLYESKLENSKWSTPEALPYPINSEFHESSLSLTSDGNIIYFTSDRDGGHGGMDIWYAQKNKAGIWNEAKNLGSEINTEHDEEGVFVHPDGNTLFFSSRGHQGMGGYDIYFTTLENGKWSKPVNLGPEINTENDDVYFVLEENGEDAYYTSVDPKTPDKKDIFKVKYNHELSQKLLSKSYSLLQGTVLRKNDKNPIEAKIEIYEGDNQTLISTLESNSQTGSFSIPLLINKNYRILIYKKGYLYHAEDIVIDSAKKQQLINKEILLEQLENNTQFVLKNIVTNEKFIDHRNQTTMMELHQLMTINPELKIQFLLEVNSNLAKSDQNNYQNTIDEYINYLKLNGINQNRMDKMLVLSQQVKELTKLNLLVNIINI